jgi:hypothetical protein
MNDDEEQLAALGALRAEDDDGPTDTAPVDDDLALHLPPSTEGCEPIADSPECWTDMGTRAIARSAEGLTVINTLEVLPPFEFSV